MSKMKPFLLLVTIILIVYSNSFSQGIKDLGKRSYYEIKAMQKVEPCEITPGKILTYCVTDGSRVVYLFKDNILNGIMFQTPFLTKSKAEEAMEREVLEFQRQIDVKPSYGNGMALFYYPNSPIAVSFGLRDFKGTTFLMYYTWLSELTK
jgi:hypothetical protein